MALTYIVYMSVPNGSVAPGPVSMIENLCIWCQQRQCPTVWYPTVAITSRDRPIRNRTFMIYHTTVKSRGRYADVCTVVSPRELLVGWKW